MAKIFLNIEAEDVRDLHSTMGQILEGVPVVRSFKDEPAEPEYDEDGSPVYKKAEPQGEQTGKRTRRTKAQIEADNAAQASTSGSSGSTTSETSPQAPTSAPVSSVDPFADQIKEAVTTSDVTLAQVRAAASKFISGDHTAKDLQTVLNDVGGAPNITAIDPSKYAAVVAALEAG